VLLALTEGPGVALAVIDTEFLPDHYRVEDQVGFLLRRAHQRHVAIFQDGMAAADLTPTQFTALLKIVELGNVSQNLLGRLVATDPATIQGVVRRLMARGLVARSSDPLDRRALVLAPTGAGRNLIYTVLPDARAVTEATLAPLSVAERQHLLALLRKLV
jgi:DNA-binding MarR family transcriptional regulator